MGVSDSIQNLRVISEIAVRAYDTLVAKNPWRQPARSGVPLGAVALVGLGAVVGAGVTLALTSSSGGELREKLRSLSKEWLGGLGLEPQTMGADVQGEGGNRADAGGASNDVRENGTSAPRRKGASSGANSPS